MGNQNGHMTDDVSEVLIETLVCLGTRYEALSKKSHGIGQTPCSYERYLVIIIIIISSAIQIVLLTYLLIISVCLCLVYAALCVFNKYILIKQ